MSTRSKKLNILFGEIPKSKWVTASQEWAANLSWIQKSQKIALEVLEALDQQSMSQKVLAEKIGVSPQMVNTWLRGKENFTLETISKLEDALNVSLLHVMSVKNQKAGHQATTKTSFEGDYEKQNEAPALKTNDLKRGKIIQFKQKNYEDTIAEAI